MCVYIYTYTYVYCEYTRNLCVCCIAYAPPCSRLAPAWLPRVCKTRPPAQPASRARMARTARTARARRTAWPAWHARVHAYSMLMMHGLRACAWVVRRSAT